MESSIFHSLSRAPTIIPGNFPSRAPSANPFRAAATIADHDIYGRASKLVDQFGFVFLEEQDIQLIQEFFQGRSIVSVGSGKGYVEQQLTEAGFAVTACDVKFDTETSYFKNTTVIAADDHEFAAQRPESVLLLSAPDEGRPYAYESIRRYLEAGGDSLIYIKFFNPVPPAKFRAELNAFSCLASRQQAIQLSTFANIRGCTPTTIQLMKKRESI